MARKPKPIDVPITATDRLSAKFGKISSRIEKMRAPVNRLMKAFKRLDKAAGFTKLGQGLKRIGGGLTRFVTLPLAAAGVASVKFSTNLNAGMALVGTLIPKQTERLRSLKSEVQQISIATGKSTNDISDGLFQVISAFGDDEQTIKRLNVVTKAAVAGNAETVDSLRLLSAVTKAYGDTSERNLKLTSDLAFETNRLGQTTFAEMASAIPTVTSLAKNQAVTMRELFGIYATGTGVTGNASEVSTQLNGVLKALAKPSKEMLTIFKALNVTTGKQLIKQVGLKNAFFSIAKAAKATNQPLIKLFGRIEGFKLIAALTGAQADTFRTKMDAMNSVLGATDAAFLEVTSGINESGFKLAQFKQLVIVTAQKVGDTLAPALASLLSKLVPIFKAFLNMNDTARKTILIAAGIAAALGPVIFAVGTLIVAIGALTPLLIAGAAIITGTVIPAVLAFTVALLTNPIFLIAAGIALVIGILAKFTSVFDPIIDKIKSFFGFIGGDTDVNINGPKGGGKGPTSGGSFLDDLEGGISEKTINNNTQNTARIELDLKGAPAGTTVKKVKNDGVDFNMKLGPVGAL